jgi:hypothetical protein
MCEIKELYKRRDTHLRRKKEERGLTGGGNISAQKTKNRSSVRVREGATRSCTVRYLWLVAEHNCSGCLRIRGEQTPVHVSSEWCMRDRETGVRIVVVEYKSAR